MDKIPVSEVTTNRKAINSGPIRLEKFVGVGTMPMGDSGGDWYGFMTRSALGLWCRTQKRSTFDCTRLTANECLGFSTFEGPLPLLAG